MIKPESSHTEELFAGGDAFGPLVLRLWSPRNRGGTTRMLDPGASLEIGSGASCALRLEEPTLSASHCRVEHRSTFVEVVDLASTNGIEIGGASVRGAQLWPGASVSLGAASLEVLEPSRSAGDGVSGVEPLPGLAGSSAVMLKVAARVRRIAPLALPVLVRGESGTGKELVARAIHRESGRDGSFVALNAAAISPALAESELFGHRRGAFTGASENRRGAFTEAHNGTLFLDEIGALPLDVQAKLLRVVEDGMVRPLGSGVASAVDVRLVAATCEAIENRVETGGFRADLFERLAACIVRLPPLRDRRADIPEIARDLLVQLGLADMRLSCAAERTLFGRRFRGNVRELRNLLASAAVLAGDGSVIKPEHLLDAIDERQGSRLRLGHTDVLRTYEASGRNTTAAARALGVPRSTLRDAIRRQREAG
ncbi:MAG: sigma 54-interacting transcriptional regulator [Polyangiaceae bacterium]|nr:sigma 54-interacting transcriptional regulator [Polyangiaceae bacterium]